MLKHEGSNFEVIFALVTPVWDCPVRVTVKLNSRLTLNPKASPPWPSLPPRRSLPPTRPRPVPPPLPSVHFPIFFRRALGPFPCRSGELTPPSSPNPNFTPFSTWEATSPRAAARTAGTGEITVVSPPTTSAPPWAPQAGRSAGHRFSCASGAGHGAGEHPLVS